MGGIFDDKEMEEITDGLEKIYDLDDSTKELPE